MGWRGEQIQGPREGVVDGDLLGSIVEEEEAAATAVFDLPPGGSIFVVGYPGEEDIHAADSGSDVWLAATADGREGGDVFADGFEEESEERGRVERAEAAAEGGGADYGEEGTGGEGGAD
jgi:hypothetical protein